MVVQAFRNDNLVSCPLKTDGFIVKLWLDKYEF